MEVEYTIKFVDGAVVITEKRTADAPADRQQKKRKPGQIKSGPAGFTDGRAIGQAHRRAPCEGNGWTARHRTAGYSDTDR